MKTRVFLGASLLLVLVAFFVLDHVFETRALISSLICLLGVAGWLEAAWLAGISSRGEGRNVSLVLVGLAGTAFFLGVAWWESAQLPAAGTGRDLTETGLAVLTFAAFVSVLFRGDYRGALSAVLFTIVGALLFGFLFSYILRIYHRPDGLRLGLVFILGVKGNDIVAYFTGRAIGRHTFLKVSPKKTLEGCSAAVIFSVLWFIGAGSLWPATFFHWPQAIVVGIIFSLTTQIGDLSESLIKRSYGVKDSAALLPEFGGVLDLIDSTLFSGFLFWSLL